MKVRRLAIADVPGLPEGLTIDGIDAPVVLLLGPNASGKSTFRRCVEQLFFERHEGLRHAALDGRFATARGLLRAQQRGGRVRWTLDGRFVERPELPTRERAECYAIGARALLAAGDTEAGFAAEVRRAMAGGFDLVAVREALGAAARRPRFGAHEAQELREARDRLLAVEDRLRRLADDEDRLTELREEVARAEQAATELASTRAALDAGRKVRERLAPVRGEVAEREAQREEVRGRLAELEAAGPLPPAADLTAARVTLEGLRQREEEERRAREAVERTGARLAATVDELGPEAGAPPPVEDFGELDALWTEREGVRRELEALEARLAALGDGAVEVGEREVEKLAGAIEDLENWLAASPVDDRPLPRPVLYGAALVAVGGTAAAAFVSLWFTLPAALALGLLAAEWQRTLSSTPARVQRDSAHASFRARGVAPPAIWEQHPVRERASALRDERERLRRAESTAGERARLGAELERARERREVLDGALATWAERVGVRREAAGLELLEWTRRCAAWRDDRRRHAEERGALTAAVAARAEAASEAAALLAAGAGAPPGYAALTALLEEHQRRAVDRNHALERQRNVEGELERRRAELERVRAEAEAAAARLGVTLDELEDAALEAHFEPRIDALERVAGRRDALRDEIQKIQTRLDDARRDDDFERALAERDEARADLVQAREARFDALGVETLLDDVEREYERESRPVVLERAAELFARFTQRRYDLIVETGAGGEPEFAAFDVEAEARRDLEALSDGTRMQLLFSLRVAFAETGEGAERLPLVLDEVFAMSDPRRIRAMVETIAEIADEDRQVIYLGADPTLGVAWAEIAREAGRPEPCVVHLDREQPVSRPVAAAVQLAIAPARSVPSPDGRSAAEYGAAIGADLPAADDEPGRLHLFHLLSDDLESLARLLRQGVARLGQWEQLARGDGGAQALGDPRRAARLDARAAVARAALASWHVGRGRRIGRAELEASGAVTDTFLDNLESLAADLGGDAAALIEALEVEGAARDERAKRFKKAKREQLEDWLTDRGFIDRRHPLTLEEQDARAREAAGDALAPEEATDLATNLRQYLEATAAPAPRAADDGAVDEGQVDEDGDGTLQSDRESPVESVDGAPAAAPSGSTADGTPTA